MEMRYFRRVWSDSNDASGPQIVVIHNLDTLKHTLGVYLRDYSVPVRNKQEDVVLVSLPDCLVWESTDSGVDLKINNQITVDSEVYDVDVEFIEALSAATRVNAKVEILIDTVMHPIGLGLLKNLDNKERLDEIVKMWMLMMHLGYSPADGILDTLEACNIPFRPNITFMKIDCVTIIDWREVDVR
jgi:hypothetical protein